MKFCTNPETVQASSIVAAAAAAAAVAALAEEIYTDSFVTGEDDDGVNLSEGHGHLGEPESPVGYAAGQGVPAVPADDPLTAAAKVN